MVTRLNKFLDDHYLVCFLENGADFLLEMKYLGSILLVLMGSMDCLTTVIGITYFGTQELNPIIAGLVHTNLPTFVILKLTVTVMVGLIFIWAEKTLMQNNSNKHEKSFRVAYATLRVSLAGIVIFLVIVVVNNSVVLLKTL